MKLKNSKIAKRLVLCLASLLIPVILINVASNVYSMTILRNEILSSSKALFDTLTKDIDGVLSGIKLNAYNLSSDVELLALNTKADMTPSRILQHRRQILNLGYVARSSSLNMEINVYFLESGKIISSGGTMVSIKQELNIKTLENAGSQGLWTFTQSKNKEKKMSYRYLVKGDGNREGVVISMDIPVAIVKSLLESIKVNSKGSSFLYLEDGETLYTNNNALTVTKHAVSRQVSSETAVEELGETRDRKIIMYRSICGGSINICSFFSQAEIMENSKLTTLVSTGVIILSAALGLVLVLMAYKILVKPIHTLVGAMRDVGENNLSVEIPYEEKDEIGFMYAQFNAMVTKLQTLINQVYLQKIYNQQMKISMYQAQINPHFLHNCLNFMNQSALAHSDDYTAKMSQFLSRYFRYNISAEDMTTSLSDEVGIVTAYIEIQRMRFPGKIKYSIDIQGEAQEIRIPKLTVQPLVENCFVHVLGKIDKQLIIDIKAAVLNNKLSITVSDNSGLVTAEGLQQLNKSITGEDCVETGIGLSNIHSRISSHFGENSGLRLSCNESSLKAEIFIELKGEQND